MKMGLKYLLIMSLGMTFVSQAQSSVQFDSKWISSKPELLTFRTNVLKGMDASKQLL